MFRRLAFGLLLPLAALGLRVGDARAQDGLAFTAAVGVTGVSGDYGEILDYGGMAEFDVFYQYRALRFGIGVNVASIDFDEEVADGFASKTGFYGAVALVFAHRSRVRPYLQFRGAFASLRPEGEVLEPIDPEEEDEPGENPSDRVTGWDGQLVPGIEFAFSDKFALDLSGTYGRFQVGEIDLSPIGRDPVDSGYIWSVRLGAVWRP